MKLRAIIKDTLRETISKGTLLFFFGLSTVILIVLFFIIRIDTANGVSSLSIFSNPIPDAAKTKLVEAIQIGLIQTAFFGIILFGIFAVAGIIPSTMERGTIDLYLSKPLSRAFLLLGKYLGALCGVGVNLLYVITGCWLIFGLKTGVWNFIFLYSFVVFLFIFAIMLCFIVLLGVIMRSSGFTIMFAFIYIFIADPLLTNRTLLLYPLWNNTVFHRLIDGVYYVLPQLSAIQKNTVMLLSGSHMNPYPFYTTTASGVAAFILASILFQKKDF